MKAREIMTTDVVSVDKDERLPTVLERLQKDGPSKIPVTENGRFAGLLVVGDIADELGAVKNRGVATAQLYVTTAYRKQVSTISPDTPLAEIVYQMVEDDLGILPVVQDGAILGVVTASDLLKRVTSTRPLSEIMMTSLHLVNAGDRVIHARRTMLDNHVERLPVTDGGKLVGIIGERDVALGLWDFREKVAVNHQTKQLKEFLVLHIMESQVVTGTPSMTAAEAAKRMTENDVGCLPVLQGDRISGIVTRSDLLKLLDV